MNYDEEIQHILAAEQAHKEHEDAIKDIIQSIYEYKQYDDFLDIPERLRTQDGVYNWLFTKDYHPGKDGKSVIDYFRQIPVELLSDKALEIAVTKDVMILAEIDPGVSKDYLALCIAGYQSDALAVSFIHKDFRTARTVDALINEGLPQSFARCHADIPWMASVMTPELIEKAAISSFYFMVSLPDYQVSDAALTTHLSVGFLWYSQLREAGRLNLAARLMKTGVWPIARPMAGEEHQPIPKDIGQALDFAVQLEGHPRAYQALYMAYMMAQPIDQVVACMKTRQQIALGLEMYSYTELRPFMKTNRHLKAAMLEESLGL
jgi:hypothetical protein